MSLAKLTAISTNTLSLFLERQRLQTLPPYPTDGHYNGSTLHYPQIKRNLTHLREGILDLESKDGSTSEASKLLRSQYDRMRSMLLEEERVKIPRSVICQTLWLWRTSTSESLPARPVLIRSNRLRYHCHPKWAHSPFQYTQMPAIICRHNPHLRRIKTIQTKISQLQQSQSLFCKYNDYWWMVGSFVLVSLGTLNRNFKFCRAGPTHRWTLEFYQPATSHYTANQRRVRRTSWTTTRTRYGSRPNRQ